MNWHGLLDESKLSALLEGEYVKFAKPVSEALAVFLGYLPPDRQAEILAKQATLDSSAVFAERLAVLAACCPVLQKIGQLLARNQSLSYQLRKHLIELESALPTIPLETIQQTLQKELGPLNRMGVRLSPPAIAEASVAVVIPFEFDSKCKSKEGVFKILKPGIEKALEDELRILEKVGNYLDGRCEELNIPRLEYGETFRSVREKLLEEICLENEQKHLIQAKALYAENTQVHIPDVFEFCTPRVTAMERIHGTKITKNEISNSQNNEIPSAIVEALIVKPIFSEQDQALFHCDPHAGNLLWTTEGRLSILDWSLVGYISKKNRIRILQVLLASLKHDSQTLTESILALDENQSTNKDQLCSIVKKSLKKLRWGQVPGIGWLVALLDGAVKQASLRLSTELMLFRKSLFTVESLVSEIEATTNTLERVVCVEFIRHLAIEWPQRWFSLPNSRDFPTSISNFDLLSGIVGVPNVVTKILYLKAKDIIEFSQQTRGSMPQGAINK